MKYAQGTGHAAQAERGQAWIANGFAEAANLSADAAAEAEAALLAEWERVDAEMEAEADRMCRAIDAAFDKAAQEIGEEYERLVEAGVLPRRVEKGADILLTEEEQDAAVLSLQRAKMGCKE
jgi:hypothetical protein